MRYYSLPLTDNGFVAVGIAGSSTARFDGSFDKSMYVDNLYARDGLRQDLPQRSLMFVPTLATPRPSRASYTVSSSLLASPGVPALLNTTILNMTAGGSFIVPVGFSFVYYDTRQSFLAVNSQGSLQFSARPDPSDLGTAFPIVASDYTATHLLAFFWTRLTVPSATSTMYATTGVFPNRVFTLRFIDVQYTTSSASTVTLDVQLHEIDSRIAMSYYSVGQSAQLVVIGAQFITKPAYDRSIDYTTWANGVPLSPRVAAALNGTQVTFTPTTPVIPVSVSSLPPLPPPPFSINRPSSAYFNMSVRPSVVPRVVLPAPTVVAITYHQLIRMSIGFTMYLPTAGFTSFLTYSTYGNVQFGSSPVLGSSPQLPFVVFASVPSAPFPSPFRVSYQTLGALPSRSFVLRVEATWFALGVNHAVLNMIDVVLQEMDESFELRYYAMSPTYLPLRIGIHAGLPDMLVNVPYCEANCSQVMSFSTVRFEQPWMALSSSVPRALSSSEPRPPPPPSSSVPPPPPPLPSSSALPPSSSAPPLSSSALPPSSSAFSSTASAAAFCSSVPTVANPSAASTESSSSSSSLSAGAFAGIAIVCVVVGAVLGAVLALYLQKRRLSGGGLATASPLHSTNTMELAMQYQPHSLQRV